MTSLSTLLPIKETNSNIFYVKKFRFAVKLVFHKKTKIRKIEN